MKLALGYIKVFLSQSRGAQRSNAFLLGLFWQLDFTGEKRSLAHPTTRQHLIPLRKVNFLCLVVTPNKSSVFRKFPNKYISWIKENDVLKCSERVNWATFVSPLTTTKNALRFCRIIITKTLLIFLKSHCSVTHMVFLLLANFDLRPLIASIYLSLLLNFHFSPFPSYFKTQAAFFFSDFDIPILCVCVFSNSSFMFWPSLGMWVLVHRQGIESTLRELKTLSWTDHQRSPDHCF